jgi:hypothetical protein
MVINKTDKLVPGKSACHLLSDRALFVLTT